MSQVIELLEQKLIPLEKQLADTRKPFSDKINNNYFKPYGITNNDVNAYTKAVCAKKINYGQRTPYGGDGGDGGAKGGTWRVWTCLVDLTR